MNELFKSIIEGEKNLAELKTYIDQSNKDILRDNNYLYRWEQVSELFLMNASRRYQNGSLKREYIDSLLEEYSNFISSNEVIKKYFLSKGNPSLELTHLNHDLVKMITSFIDKMNELDNRKAEKLRREYGYIHPLLLSTITIGISIITLGTIYLNI